MHPLSALALVGIFGAGLLIAPVFDRSEQDIGIYFRSPLGRRIAAVCALLALNLTPILVVLDEYWIDLPAWLPGLPPALTMGIIPFVLTLGVLAGVYALARRAQHQGQRATHSEALLGAFSFVATALIVLTITGIFFRGPHMALVLPF
jgi:hypothetical protein